MNVLPVVYYPRIFSPEDQANVLRRLQSDVKWERHDTNRVEALFKRHPAPYYYSLTRGERPYHPQLEPSALAYVWENVQAFVGCKFEACFINWYEREVSHIGWHRDNSPSIDQTRPIAVLSLGAGCLVRFRSSLPPITADSLKVEGGSLYVMQAGMQEHYRHAVYGTAGARLSLVFRGMSGYTR